MEISLIISADITDSYGFNVLASQLKKLEPKGVKTRLFYIFYKFNEKYPEKVVKQLVALCKNSDLIGISLLSSAFRNSIQITRALKKETNCPIVWGGKHPTADPEDCIKYADIVALSEGEDTLFEIVEAILNNKPLDNIKGTWVKKDGQIIKNELREIETNLDRFSFPDYSLANKFVLDKEEIVIRPAEDTDLDDMQKWYPTMITRGCPNCCTFCTNSVDFRLRKMRSRSIENVISEVKRFLNQYPDTRKIFFRDDCISAMSLDFIKEFSEKWKKEVGLPCSCSGVIATSDNFRKKIELLTEAGFVNFKMGIQSGCERVRRFVFARVGETDKVIKEAVKVLHEIYRGRINYYMITDNPYESEDELIESIRFTSKIPRPFSLSLYSLNFYPGTALYNRALRDKIIINKDETLQESTMEMKNTYLNKVFIALRHFALPPFVVKIMTNKKIYKSKYYLKIFNIIYKFLFNSGTPNRRIKKPVRPIRVEIFKNIRNSIRWFVWEIFARAFMFFHKKIIK